MFLIDPREGASGDMILGALIASSGVPLREMEELLSSSGSVMGETVVRLRRVEERGVEALEVDVRWEEGEGDIEALKMKAHLLDALQAAGLSRENRFAREAFERIVRAEEEVHNEPLAYLKLHETGTPDTLVDIVGVAFLREKLELEGEWVEALPPGVGRGAVVIAHGVYPVPAPATRIIMRGLPYTEGPWEGELLTPTGATLLKGLVDIWRREGEAPEGLKLLGAGVGSRSFAGRRSLLKIYGG
ncbi:MAG: hypothetical protein DRN55_03650 [Thermoplasmata archaeon]|nr:MAG: hypothetical protein DRN55_03650 [Thermoplasmata archaeon]